MSTTDKFWDALETRSDDERNAQQMSALRQQVHIAKDKAPAYRELLADIDPDTIVDRAAVAKLPITRKSELLELQAANPPFGGFNATPTCDVLRVYHSPGPIFEPETARVDYWRVARALYAAGLRAGTLVHNTYSYHFTPAGFILESGARAIGCPVFAAGVGQTELQLETIERLRPEFYVGTPSFLKILLEKAAEAGADMSSMKRGAVSGEALPPSLRAQIKALGVEVLQGYATADVGSIAYESEAVEGMILDEGAFVEIVRPGTGDPVAEGEVGEVVVTNFNPDYPLIRLATGDLSAVLPGQSPCGRTNMRIKGWLGRADQTTKIRGMFVRPNQVAEVLKRHPEVKKARLVVTSADAKDGMTLQCEFNGTPTDGLSEALAVSIRDLCKLRGEVAFVAPGSLPNDGKIIDDQRSYE